MFTFTIVHCLDSTLWVQDYPWGMNFFILDCVFLATYRSRKNGVRNPAPESWILDFRILRFGSRQVLSFSFAHKTGGSWTRWWTGIQGSAKNIDSGYWCPEMWSNCVQKWQLATDTELWQLWTTVSIKNWLFLLCDFQLHFRRLQWKIRIGGLSHGRTARRNLPCQGIVSGNSYLPTKGSKGTQSNIYLLNFGKFEWTVLKS